jgi:hypothetical protein
MVFAHTETLTEVVQELSARNVNIRRVEYLSIRSNIFINDDDFDKISLFVNLRHLLMEGCRNIKSVAPLGNLKSLRTLDVGQCYGISTLKPLSGLYITELTGCYLNDMGIEFCKLPLAYIKCYSTYDFSFLLAYKDTLRELHIVSGGMNPSVVGCKKKIDLESFPCMRMSKLEKLVIDAEDMIVDDSLLQAAKSMRSLTEVDVWAIKQIGMDLRNRKTMMTARREPGSDVWRELQSICCM